MKFTLNHARSLTGNDITVAVEADDGKNILRVWTQLDGFELANDTLVLPSESYERTFVSAGTAGPGTQHTLLVSVEQDDANTRNATSVWVDSN
jgi:hypothetical protein